METVIMHPQNKEQLVALKAFAKALKVNFETEKSPYNPDFVAKIKESQEQVKQGNVISIKDPKNIWPSIYRG
jgi:hypothetical protein